MRNSRSSISEERKREEEQLVVEIGSSQREEVGELPKSAQTVNATLFLFARQWHMAAWRGWMDSSERMGVCRVQRQQLQVSVTNFRLFLFVLMERVRWRLSW